MRQRISIFNRHARPLRQIREHGVCSVSDQRHTAYRMFMCTLHGRSTTQGPQTPIAAMLYQLLQMTVRTAHGMLQRLLCWRKGLWRVPALQTLPSLGCACGLMR